MRSLRMRLFWWTALVSAVVLGILWFAIDRAVHQTLVREFDNVLLEKARAIASMVEQDPDGVHFEFETAEFPEFSAKHDAAYFEVFVGGKAFARSASLGNAELPADADEASNARARKEILPDGGQGRFLGIAFKPYVDPGQEGNIPNNTRPTASVTVARNTEELEKTLLQIRWLTGGLCGLGVLLSGLVLLVVTNRAVRPVRALARRIETLDEKGLSAELDASRLPAELAPIAEKLNGFLRRLQGAFARERAFTADVAHELRTPLAGLLATLEVCASRPRESTEYEAAIAKCLHMLRQMERLVERLLLLARAENGQLHIRTGAVDLMEVMEESLAAIEPGAVARGIRFVRGWEAGQEWPAMADRELLRIVLGNLLDNAAHYAEAGSAVELHVTGVGSQVAAEVISRGHGLTEEDLPRLFERFWRKDAARSSTGLHAGLGLSLAQRLMRAQHGEISVRLEGDRFVATVELPRAQRGPAMAPPVKEG